MYRKIVAGYQADQPGEEALALARTLAEALSAHVIVSTVVDMRGTWGLDRSVLDGIDHDAEARIDDAIRGWPPSFRTSVRVLHGSSPAGCLHALAEQEGADLLVLGHTHMGRLGRALVGSTAEYAMYGAPCPVALAPDGYERPMAGIRTVGVAFDGSAQAHAALEWGARLAEALDASLCVVAVVDALRDEMRERIDEALAGVLYRRPVEVRIPVGEPADELRSSAADGIDLLVTGSRNRGPFTRVVLGSVSLALATSCPSPLIVIPRVPAHEEAPEGAYGNSAPSGARPVFSTAQHELSPDEVATLIGADAAQIVDVRDEYQLGRGSLPHARSIPLGRLASEAGTLDHERPVVFCSGGGERGALAMHACRAAGMNAYNLRGGIRAWEAAGLPIGQGARSGAPS